MKEGIEVKNLSIGYRKKALIEGLSIEFKEGEFWTVIGPNGVGKSTLIKTILGIAPPISGKVFIHGVDCTYTNCPERHFLSYVPQMESYSHDFPATALDVVLSGFSPRMKRFEFISENKREEGIKWMKTLGIEEIAGEPFNRLSGGQQRKVLIARALIGNPHYLFLDEPTTGVDIKSSRKILKLLSKLNKEENFGILVVTHDINFIWEYMDKVIVLGKGKFVAGNKEEILNSEVLSEIYEVNIKVTQTEFGPVFLIGDKHV